MIGLPRQPPLQPRPRRSHPLHPRRHHLPQLPLPLPLRARRPQPADMITLISFLHKINNDNNNKMLKIERRKL